jgi:hypothetical protein
MKGLTLSFLFAIFFTSAHAEVCEGLNACNELYTKLSKNQLTMDKTISDEVTMAVQGTDLTAENYKTEYPLYLSKNTISLSGKTLKNMRNGEFLTSPIYIVSENNMPQMINKDGLVTLVYHAKKSPKKLLTSKVTKMISFSRPNPKAHYSILEFPTKVIAVSHTFEYATKMMKEIMKADE